MSFAEAQLEQDAGQLVGESDAADLVIRTVQPLVLGACRQATAVREQATPQAVHALRGGLRRLGAALDLFGVELGDADVARIRDDLNWLLRRFGRVRDLDVLIARLEADMAYRPQCTNGDVLRAAASDARDRAAAKAIHCLAGLRAQVLLGGLATWRPLACNSASPGLPGANAIASLARQDAALRHAGRHLERLGRKGRHRLRGRVKALRHGAEALAFLIPLPAPYGASLLKLHHVLGDWNDLAVGSRLVRRLGSTTGHPGGLGGQPEHDASRRRLADAWAQFEATPSPWNISQGAADLRDAL